jgi:hypothetical protein
MSIQWGPLLAVFVVSLGSTIAVVVLITVAMLGWSRRAARVGDMGISAVRSSTEQRRVPSR